MSSSRRSFFYGFLLALVSVGLLAAVPVFAEEVVDLKAFAESAGFVTGSSIEVIITRLIRTFLGLVGIVLVVMIIYAGFLWMTSKGNATQLERAKKMLTQAIIGVLIVLSSFGIVQFVHHLVHILH